MSTPIPLVHFTVYVIAEILQNTNFYLQLDWPSETATLRIDLPQDRKGYNGFEYGRKALDEAHLLVRGKKHIFFFGELFLKIDKK